MGTYHPVKHTVLVGHIGVYVDGDVLDGACGAAQCVDGALVVELEGVGLRGRGGQLGSCGRARAEEEIAVGAVLHGAGRSAGRGDARKKCICVG